MEDDYNSDKTKDFQLLENWYILNFLSKSPLFCHCLKYGAWYILNFLFKIPLFGHVYCKVHISFRIATIAASSSQQVCYNYAPTVIYNELIAANSL